MARARKLAVFDLDGTLIPLPSSEWRFALQLLRSLALGPRQFAHAAAFALRWAPRFGHHVWKKNKGYLAGLETDDVERRADDFVQHTLLSLIRPSVLARLRAHQTSGDTVILMTGSADFIALPLCRELGIEHCIATQCLRRNGAFSVDPPQHHPFGADKVALLRRYCKRSRLSLKSATAYADSIHDLALLQTVQHAVAVFPDSGLERAARRRGWEVVRD